jgi:hypothetical protein
MPAAIVARSDRSFTIQITVPYKASMLDAEEAIQKSLNDAGVAATAEALTRFDADGKPLRIGPTKLTSKGKLLKQYQTPYGVASVKRHVYQTSRGGRTFCPLDQNARIVVSSTPRFARMLAHKYAEFGSARVTEDLHQNHGRVVARSFVQSVADAVSAVALAKEEAWEYALPKLEQPPAAITISLDGTCVLMCEDGWREAMVGSIGLYDKQGERLHTIYAAATPEYGKLTFLERLDREIERVKTAYPDALYVGLADGAKDNWIYLELKTQRQVVDFYHVTQYVWSAAETLFAGTPAAAEMRPWIDDWCHRLKHEPGAAAALIADLEVRGLAPGKKRLPEEIERTLTYLRNQLKGGRLDYPSLVEQHVPIGSGVAEAACKVLVKQRLCGSGMRWKERGAAAVLSVRALTYTAGRWSQFWGKIDRYGFPVAA